jgi:ankyrin repeat domain-containing protein 50
LNSRDDTYRRSALSWAAGKGFDAVVKLLINDGRQVFKLQFWKRAKIDSVDRYGRTPLSYAVWIGNVDVVKVLINAGARADSKDEIGGTPLSYAVCNGYKKVIELLLKGDTQVGLKDISKELLFSAAKKGHEDVVRLLIDTGKTDLDVRDNDGQTPLSQAARNGHGATVKLLLTTGKVDINTKNKNGWTPLLWAIEEGHKDVVELLLEVGAKVDYEYTVDVNEPVSSLVHASVELIANSGTSGCYSM